MRFKIERVFKSRAGYNGALTVVHNSYSTNWAVVVFSNPGVWVYLSFFLNPKFFFLLIPKNVSIHGYGQVPVNKTKSGISSALLLVGNSIATWFSSRDLAAPTLTHHLRLHFVEIYPKVEWSCLIWYAYPTHCYFTILNHRKKGPV